MRPLIKSSIAALLLVAATTLADVTGRVVAVTDGDTIKVLDAEKVQHKVRLIGIDAPERGQPVWCKYWIESYDIVIKQYYG